jgi:type IV secretory pathway TrbF-like protein
MSAINQLLPPPMKDDHAAGRQFLEIYGSALNSATYWKLVALALAISNLGLLTLQFSTVHTIKTWNPPILERDEFGGLHLVRPSVAAYQPQEATLKYFLVQFVEWHYGRIRATIRDNFTRSLYFLDGRLAGAVIEASKKNKLIETVLTGQTDEVEINVKNVVIEDTRQQPYKARVDFEKVYYAPSDRTETKREKYTASFVFVVKGPQSNALVPVNPIGLTITYFHEDQAFD